MEFGDFMTRKVFLTMRKAAEDEREKTKENGFY